MGYQGEMFTLTLALSHQGRGDTSTLTPGSSPGQALALSHRGTFAQLDIGAVTIPNRRLVPVCPTPLDGRTVR